MQNWLKIESSRSSVVVLPTTSPTAFAAIKSAKSVQARYQMHKSFNNVPAEEQAPDEFVANKENLTGPDAAKCGANLIKMSVAPDGKSYTISVPATGHSRTYKTKG